jgi:hypothetical protein
VITFKAMAKLKTGDTIFCLRSGEIQETPYTLCKIPFEIVPALVLRMHGSEGENPPDNSIDIAWKDTGTTMRVRADYCFHSDDAARTVIRSHIDYMRSWLGEMLDVILESGSPPTNRRERRFVGLRIASNDIRAPKRQGTILNIKASPFAKIEWDGGKQRTTIVNVNRIGKPGRENYHFIDDVD